jgi:hypothetical protein
MEENNRMSLTMYYVLRGGSSWMKKKGTSINSSEAFFCYLKLNHEIMIKKKQQNVIQQIDESHGLCSRRWVLMDEKMKHLQKALSARRQQRAAAFSVL